jgi:hypothetical protein
MMAERFARGSSWCCGGEVDEAHASDALCRGVPPPRERGVSGQDCGETWPQLTVLLDPDDAERGMLRPERTVDAVRGPDRAELCTSKSKPRGDMGTTDGMDLPI